MAEFIDRQELIDNLNKFAPEHYNALVNQLIMKQPIADVVEVVRCKDCNYYKKGFAGEHSNYCDCHTVTSFDKFFCKPNDFCSCGERKGDNG